jgi:hypothetical protein
LQLLGRITGSDGFSLCNRSCFVLLAALWGQLARIFSYFEAMVRLGQNKIGKKVAGAMRSSGLEWHHTSADVGLTSGPKKFSSLRGEDL